MTPTIVNPQVYYAASAAMFTEYQALVDAVSAVLNPGLAGSKGMAGNYPAVARWVTEYSSAAADVESVLVAYGNALLQMREMFNLAGYTWAKANYNAGINRTGAAPSLPTMGARPVWNANSLDIPDPMPAAYTTSHRGLNTNPDTHGDKLRTIFQQNSTQVPTGNTNALSTAAASWQAFSTHDVWTGGTGRLQAVISSFDEITAPEKTDLLEMLNILRTATTTIAEAAHGFAMATCAHTTELENLRSTLTANAPTAFPDAGVVASKTFVEVLIVFGRELTDDALQTGGTVLAQSVSGHSLYSLLARAEFSGTATLPQTKNYLEEIAGSPVDELTNRASWKSSAPKCELNPEGQRDYGGSNSIVTGWIDDAVAYGNAAGVDPKLVLAIIYNEGGNRSDTQLEHAGSGILDAGREIGNPIREKTNPAGMGMSLGLTNIKENTYNKLQEEYPEEFGSIPWERVQYDDSVAIKAAAYTLKRVQDQYGSEVPDTMKEKYSTNDFMAAGYNSEGAMPDYLAQGDLGPQVKNYLAMNEGSYQKASELIDGAYTCR
ncbi:hypothetical protein [Nocardia mangyaensis]|uniref:hypothetical protein n=1 Tax=Nocardia mangyaensis TaxID=2213200 RepID=UPI00267513AC|nr:hypothetical protein [Nocardia mangyaensis]MDO3650375.1 hypothetical protein [Nocardia mangyaensis]